MNLRLVCPFFWMKTFNFCVFCCVSVCSHEASRPDVWMFVLWSYQCFIWIFWGSTSEKGCWSESFWNVDFSSLWSTGAAEDPVHVTEGMELKVKVGHFELKINPRVNSVFSVLFPLPVVDSDEHLLCDHRSEDFHQWRALTSWTDPAVWTRPGLCCWRSSPSSHTNEDVRKSEIQPLLCNKQAFEDLWKLFSQQKNHKTP